MRHLLRAREVVLEGARLHQLHVYVGRSVVPGVGRLVPPLQTAEGLPVEGGTALGRVIRVQVDAAAQQGRTQAKLEPENKTKRVCINLKI